MSAQFNEVDPRSRRVGPIGTVFTAVNEKYLVTQVTSNSSGRRYLCTCDRLVLLLLVDRFEMTRILLSEATFHFIHGESDKDNGK